MSAGVRFWQALEAEKPLQVVGTINAYSALLAQKAGFHAIYLSGAGVANASFGLPDLAMTTLGDVCEDIRRISYATELPLLVDADTGWGGAFMIGRSVREMIRAGAFDVLRRPLADSDVDACLERSIRQCELVREWRRLRELYGEKAFEQMELWGVGEA